MAEQIERKNGHSSTLRQSAVLGVLALGVVLAAALAFGTPWKRLDGVGVGVSDALTGYEDGTRFDPEAQLGGYCPTCGKRPPFAAEPGLSDTCNDFRRLLDQTEWREDPWAGEDIALLEGVVLGELAASLAPIERVLLACEALRVARDRLRRSADGGEDVPLDALCSLIDGSLAHPSARVRYNAVRLGLEPIVYDRIRQGISLAIESLTHDLPPFAIRELKVLAALGSGDGV